MARIASCTIPFRRLARRLGEFVPPDDVHVTGFVAQMANGFR
ncbi:hypothetical protein [Novosphingobium beihaiensis]|nr:hypothetical protein [Novosphingobium beihaiensis]